MKLNLRSAMLRALICLPLLLAPIACGGDDHDDDAGTGMLDTGMGTMDTGMGTMDTGFGTMDTGMMDTGAMGTMDTGAMGTMGTGTMGP